MGSKDEFTLYGSMEHATYECQRIARQRLWEIQVARVLAWVADEEFDAWEQEFDPQDSDDSGEQEDEQVPVTSDESDPIPSSHDKDRVETGQDQDSTKKGRKKVTFDDAVQLFTYQEPGHFDKSWRKLMAKGNSDITVDELNQLTVFSPHNLPHVPISTSRPRLTNWVANKPTQPGEGVERPLSPS